MTEQKLGAVLEIRDNASRTLEQVTRVAQRAEQQTQQLAKMIEKMDRQFHSSERQTTRLVAQLNKLNMNVAKLGTTSQRTETEVSRLDRALSRLGTIGSNSIGRLGSAMGGVLSRATQLAAVVGTVAGGGALMQMFKGGAALEQYQMNTKLNLQNWNGLSDSEALIQSQNYLGGAEKYANYTPFSTTDVMAAANRLIGVTQGDTTLAEKLYKLSGDMASATPGKTIMDSAEALSDAFSGEFERINFCAVA